MLLRECLETKWDGVEGVIGEGEGRVDHEVRGGDVFFFQAEDGIRDRDG